MLSRLALFAVLATSSALVHAQYAGATPVPDEYKKGFDSITPAEGRPWLTYLSSKQLEGRGSGQPGFQKAADFVAGKFKEFGLKPMGDKGTFFQMVPFQRSRVDSSKCSFSVGGKSLKVGKDIGFNTAKDGPISGQIVFIRAKGEKANLPTDSLEGKIVVLALDPTVPRRAQFTLFQANPAMILTVADSLPAADWNINGPSRGMRRGAFSAARITPEAAREIAKTCGVDASLVNSSAETADHVTVTPTSTEAKGEMHMVTEQIDVPNVVGLLEGTDPTLKSEVVGIGAHLDHLGKRGPVWYPGADDDGSGSTAVLEIVKAMHDNPVKPKRSILFMTFCGEELGLIGSGWLANHPPIPLDKMICELQMDMVGRNAEDKENKPEDNVKTIRLVGSKRISTELDDLVNEENKYVNLDFKYDQEAVYTRSDHYNFAAKGVPICFLFDGFHPDYHQPTDTVDKINFDKIASCAKLYFLVAMQAADRPAFFDHNVK